VVAFAGGITLALIVAARIVLLPQVVMIEGQSTGSSLGRSIKLGGGNWHRVGAIMLFAYFISLSLLAALTLPVALGLEWFSISSVEFAQTPAGDAIYSAFTQIANVLSLPIWAVSFTLLYLDNRVRKEGYDMELLAQEVAPGFNWRPPVYPYGTFPTAPAQRVYVQTGPLGLGGYAAPQTAANPQSIGSQQPPGEAEPAGEVTIAGGGEASANVFPSAGSEAFANPVVGGEATGNVVPVAGSDEASRSVVSVEAQCANCGVELPSGARFCIRCGAQT
jgi:hypothetical protein